MKNRLMVLLFTALLSLMMIVPVNVRAESEAATENRTEKVSLLVDDAELLSSSEEEKVLTELKKVSDKYSMDVVVLTVNSLEGKSTVEYADDYYDYNGYANDGLLLLISMEDRDWYISTKGYGITAFTDAGIQYIGEQIKGALGDGDYEEAFIKYAQLSDDFIQQAKSGKPYDTGSLPRGKFPVKWILISFVVGLVIALITVSGMKAKMKSVRYQAAAGSYVRSGSMKVTNSSDMFLYRKVDRTARPKDNGGGGSSTHTSSSGSSHGGGGGKF